LAQLGSLPQKKDLGDATQLRFGFGPDFMHAVAGTIRHIQKIEAEASGDMEAVKDKEKRWRNRILPRLEPYREVADLWTDTFFGHPLTEDEYLGKVRDILPQVVVQADTDSTERGEAAARYGKRPRRSYFPWELEFPAVFFDGDGTPKTNPGFDAVVSNPPYVSAIELNRALSEYEKPYWSGMFESACGAYDLYIIFLERCLTLTAPGKLCAMITPNKFMSIPYASGFREYFCRSAKLKRLLDLSCRRVFEEPSVYPVITVMEHSTPSTISTAWIPTR
ncbi:MAG: Eco57I restriction-modification methylase domain-containing protein, partial [bacterium]